MKQRTQKCEDEARTYDELLKEYKADFEREKKFYE